MVLKNCTKYFELHKDNLGPDYDLKKHSLVKTELYKIITKMRIMSAMEEMQLKFKKIKIPFLWGNRAKGPRGDRLGLGGNVVPEHIEVGMPD